METFGLMDFKQDMKTFNKFVYSKDLEVCSIYLQRSKAEGDALVAGVGVRRELGYTCHRTERRSSINIITSCSSRIHFCAQAVK
jgi:hypothetical protein